MTEGEVGLFRVDEEEVCQEQLHELIVIVEVVGVVVDIFQPHED